MFLLTDPPQHSFSSSGHSSKMSQKHHCALPWHLVSFQYPEGSCPSVSHAPHSPLERPANKVNFFFCVVYPSLFLFPSKIETIHSLGKLQQWRVYHRVTWKKEDAGGLEISKPGGGNVFNADPRPPSPLITHQIVKTSLRFFSKS